MVQRRPEGRLKAATELPDREQARRQVLTVVARIPAGCVASYGQVAFEAGLPGRARWVGKVLAETLEAAEGWHRVLRNDGALGLPKSSPAHAEQRSRLVAEGHRFHNDRLDIAARRWRPRSELPLID